MSFLFFGDSEGVRHLRVMIDTDDQSVANRCVDINIQNWVAALEVAVMLNTARPFAVPRVPDSQMLMSLLGQGEAESLAAVIDFEFSASHVDYRQIAHGMFAWTPDLNHHLFYFRRFIDATLPLDIRWLNAYRLLEWHFVQDSAGLSRCPAWRAFLSRFEQLLGEQARPGQSSWGLLEEVRALAAHAGFDDRTESERATDPRNAMEKTFAALEAMIMTVLNEHPSIQGGAVRFTPRSGQPGTKDTR